MATVVASRFACLKIEDDDEPSVKKQDPNKAKKSSAKPPNQNQKKVDTKKIKSAKAVQSNGNNNVNNANQLKKKKKQPQQKPNDWEQWKKKDSQMVDGHYEEDLQQAIILSKLDYEEKKTVVKPIEMQLENNSERIVKNKAMSLGQFNTMVEKNSNTQRCNQIDTAPDLEKDTDLQGDTEFFERIKEATKVELEKNKNQELRIPKPREQPSNEVITKSQYKATLERKDTKINELEALVEHLKGELFKTKDRNRQLCRIMGLAEMREKAEVLIQVERLHTVQEELTGEISTLHAQLEQERSRSSSYKADFKYKDKKRRMAEKD